MTGQPVYSVESEDPELQRAVAAARSTFKFFYRELSWEYRRIIPALDMAAVKVAFPVEQAGPDEPSVENMWVSDIEFDGQTLRGVLLNEPHWVHSLQAGDPVSVPFTDLVDWMYVCAGQVYGGFTVDVMRSGMDDPARAEHDAAWGLAFGEPGFVVLAMPEADGAPLRLARHLEGVAERAALADLERCEHPMAVNTQADIDAGLAQDPSLVNQYDDTESSYLHREALAGNHGFAAALLRHGADPLATDSNGRTPLQLAQRIGWPRIVELLEGRGARLH
ncbi:DUF2314 domain-containing protein [uncultured Pseudomonas sp.]|uniref:DUF2314 domain-containing protein n=1 Tax=uncultured Pseudomonas sp. TaxID=114707 RepID=UPI0025DCE58E|nr:DUF2314 domain-containing protein [uncultured Pseudomonas sp.]